MKKNPLSKIYATLILLAACTTGSIVNGQALEIKTSDITITGTTNMHDFSVQSTRASGNLVFVNGKAKSLSVDIPVRSIISKEKMMNKKTYEMFNDAKNPTINFEMTEVNSIKINKPDISVTVTGRLTMGGASKTVTLEAQGKETGAGVYSFEGNLPVNVSDWKMKAPTAMLGVMKVNDVVNVNYKVSFEGAAVTIE